MSQVEDGCSISWQDVSRAGIVSKGSKFEVPDGVQSINLEVQCLVLEVNQSISVYPASSSPSLPPQDQRRLDEGL